MASETGADSVAVSIRKWRDKAPAMSREELAAATGKSMATVQRWERTGDPRMSDVLRMEELKPGLVALLFRGVLRRAKRRRAA